ncbi:MAG: FHA domain-containing protein [Polyangiaceae bacterium]|nr:FHA domain-containing protein [Polyangiaceae bacterium]
MIRLRYLGHNLEVPEGQFVIGRSSKCQLSVDDPLISRQHAALTVNGSAATVEDLGSRNGVLVNGQKIAGVQPLTDGDTITVGSQVMTIHGIAVAGAATRPRRPEMQTLQTASLFELQEDPTDDTSIRSSPIKSIQPDKRVNELSLVGAVAEKALAMGRAEDAQRLLERPLRDVLARARTKQPIEASVAQRAATLAVKLAGALQEGDWVDFAVELYTLRRELLPQPVVDELYTVLRKVRCDASLLREYLDTVKAGAGSFGPNERFQISRIEGLEPLVGLK